MNASKHLLMLISLLGLARVNGDETNYFLVAEPPGRVVHNDSYVLPLSKPEDIAHARYLISLGPSVLLGSHSALVGAKAAAGKDGINRNYLDPTLREWSWHVAEFLRFADGSAEILDGCPTCLENQFDWSHLDGAGTFGIGFWNYTVVRELGQHPLVLSIASQGQNLEFYWSGLGTNEVYTLELSESLSGTNWAPVPGAAWPLRTNHWSLSATNASVRFFRVKAEEAK